MKTLLLLILTFALLDSEVCPKGSRDTGQKITIVDYSGIGRWEPIKEEFKKVCVQDFEIYESTNTKEGK